MSKAPRWVRASSGRSDSPGARAASSTRLQNEAVGEVTLADYHVPWNPADPLSSQFTSNPGKRTRTRVIALVILSMGLAWGVWWIVSPHKVGDPGTRISTDLQSAAKNVLPADAYDIRVDISEPQWIGPRCAATTKVGWTPVYVDVYFKSHLNHSRVSATLNRRFRETGWKYRGSPDIAGQGAVVDTMPVAWTRSDHPGFNMGADVSAPNQSLPGTWLIDLVAPPVVPVGLCEGG